MWWKYKKRIDAYNERQTDSAYKLHIGDDGGIYTSFGYRISYDYHDTTRNVMHLLYRAVKTATPICRLMRQHTTTKNQKTR